MRILFTNDDGFDAKGLHAVADLFSKEHEIAVVAPDGQRSGCSHSVTLRPNKLAYCKTEGYAYPVFALSGTPVDCVKTGVTSFFPNPDLVVSGINRGQNIGTDILYSGTVSAAIDAASMGIKAVALSLHTDDDNDPLFDDCARFFYDNFDFLMSFPLPLGACININYPATKPLGVKVARMSRFNTFVDAYAPHEGGFMPRGHRDLTRIPAATDEAFCGGGYITVTPLMTDLTDYAALKKLKRGQFKL